MINQDGRLLQVVKAVHAVGQGRQLGNVQVIFTSLNKLELVSNSKHA